MARAIIGLGANIAGSFGPPADAIVAAMARIGGVIARSRLYSSAAWPNPADPAFVNAVSLVEIQEKPEALLARLHRIEGEFGRIRSRPNAPRTLDLDIVDYAGQVSTPGETPRLPHPRMAERAFVLLPLREVAPDWVHPVIGTGIDSLIAALPRPLAATPL